MAGWLGVRGVSARRTVSGEERERECLMMRLKGLAGCWLVRSGKIKIRKVSIAVMDE